jgi:hypothetical protein
MLKSISKCIAQKPQINQHPLEGFGGFLKPQSCCSASTLSIEIFAKPSATTLRILNKTSPLSLSLGTPFPVCFLVFEIWQRQYFKSIATTLFSLFLFLPLLLSPVLFPRLPLDLQRCEVAAVLARSLLGSLGRNKKPLLFTSLFQKTHCCYLGQTGRSFCGRIWHRELGV